MTDNTQWIREPSGEGLDPYRELFERSADAILIIDDGAFVECNQATVKMLGGRDKEHILRTHPSELSPPFQSDGRASFEKANEMMRIALENGSNRFEWDHVRANGEVFPVEVLLTAVSREDRTILHVVWRDITERRQLEGHLRLSQKMEAVGRMAGGIAHDFNNMLVTIIGNSDLLAESLEESPDQLVLVDEIQAASRRAAALVRQLMAFSRKQDLQVAVVDVASALSEIENILRQLLDERYELDLRFCADPVRILAVPGQLEQIVLNLVTNARDAMPDGGPLRVEVRRLEVAESMIGLGIELRPGSYCEVAVSDLGVGMTPEVAQRAFDPFFTTKDVGKGTGLGLATVYGIAQQSGGGVHIQSDGVRGTTIRVYIPITEEEAGDSASAVVRRQDPCGTETILVVEDERGVARLEARVLRAAGYRVLLAHDGSEALEVFRSSPLPIDLVLTDVVMPRMGGVDLVRSLRKDSYSGAVLMSSGYTNNELDGETDLEMEPDLLEKPFTTTELLRRVRAAIDRGRSGSLAD